LKDGRPFSGDGGKNEQFYCYGQPVLAPADGTVVMITDTYADNAPGRPEEVMPSGNRVLISHGNKEYSVLLHLKQNSIKVKQGAKVKQGDVVGECGNSGASSAPHLEYRLQNSRGVPLPQTLPVQFVDYVADGAPVAVGEPLRGQTVRNATAPATPEEKK
jgi:murein DD-endopeptidase MepM/ murein hydrolase activator NlpD